jgi:hypothetical protein
MFEGLSTADNGGVQYLLVLDLARHVIGFFDQPIDGRASLVMWPSVSRRCSQKAQVCGKESPDALTAGAGNLRLVVRARTAIPNCQTA